MVVGWVACTAPVVDWILLANWLIVFYNLAVDIWFRMLFFLVLSCCGLFEVGFLTGIYPSLGLFLSICPVSGRKYCFNAFEEAYLNELRGMKDSLFLIVSSSSSSTVRWMYSVLLWFYFPFWPGFLNILVWVFYSFSKAFTISNLSLFSSNCLKVYPIKLKSFFIGLWDSTSQGYYSS